VIDTNILQLVEKVIVVPIDKVLGGPLDKVIVVPFDKTAEALIGCLRQSGTQIEQIGALSATVATTIPVASVTSVAVATVIAIVTIIFGHIKDSADSWSEYGAEASIKHLDIVKCKMDAYKGIYSTFPNSSTLYTVFTDGIYKATPSLIFFP